MFAVPTYFFVLPLPTLAPTVPHCRYCNVRKVGPPTASLGAGSLSCACNTTRPRQGSTLPKRQQSPGEGSRRRPSVAGAGSPKMAGGTQTQPFHQFVAEERIGRRGGTKGQTLTTGVGADVTRILSGALASKGKHPKTCQHFPCRALCTKQ